jgi:hypothetical protein
LLVVALVLAVRELVGFKPQPEWQDVGKLRDRLLRPIPPTPHRCMAGRREMIQFCLDLRAEFRVAWRLCRFLAPISHDPAYAGRLLLTKVRFNGAFVLAVALAALGARQAFEGLSERLREIGGAMRCAALVILDDADLQSSPSAA